MAHMDCVAISLMVLTVMTAEGASGSALPNDPEPMGSVTIDCSIKPNGRVKDCTVLKEYPEGHGYGVATVKLFVRYAKVAAPAGESRIAAGMRKKFTYKWPLAGKGPGE